MTYMSLTQRIQLEQGKLKPSEVTELHLDHAKATKIEGLTSDFSSLEILSLSNVGLETLDGFPDLPALKILDLSCNKISTGIDEILRCPALEQLNLSANKIDSMDALTPLAKLSSLTKLDLSDCSVASSENYRKKIFALLPNLSYLDGLDENNEQEPTDQVENGEDEVDENGEADDDEEDVNDESDEEEEYGIEALQRSGDLEDDDEEDYVPGEEEENELDEYDDLDEEDDDVDEDDDGANLSGAGETAGSRRPASKRRHEAADDADDAPVVKHKAVADEEESVNNGSAVDN